MTEPDEALDRTQREMDECCPMRDIHVIRDGKKIPCSWEGHAALKRRDAAREWKALEKQHQQGTCVCIASPAWAAKCQKERDAARRAYEEASNGK